MPLSEADVEQAALSWFQELGYAVLPVPQLTPGEPTAERKTFSDLVLVGRLRGHPPAQSCHS
jgi:type I restriction enzyme R subunit